MIFEYLPTHITQDKERLRAVCRVFPITKILIPSNPVAKPYPDSLVVVAMLQNMAKQDMYLKHIQFIPTIKTGMHTLESLQSIFLSLQYLNISHVAIISGDTTQPHALNTYHALEILKNMQKTSTFLQQLHIFCALESNISVRNSYGLCKKMQYGVRNFITQPFYLVNPEQHCDIHMACNANPPYFLPQQNIQSVATFLQFYQNLTQIYMHTAIPYCIPYKKVQIYCGFLPLSHAKQAYALHAKNIGILIPKSYIHKISNNASYANIELLMQLQHYHISMSYLHFRDIQMLLDRKGTNKHIHKNIV